MRNQHYSDLSPESYFNKLGNEAAAKVEGRSADLCHNKANSEQPDKDQQLGHLHRRFGKAH
jgi:hypothetical protein